MKIEKPEYKGWSYWKYKGEKEEQNGDFIKAIELYSEAIIESPLNEDAFISRGFVKCDIQEYESAIDDFTEAIEINPRNKYGFINRAYANLFLKNFRDVVNDSTKVLEFDCMQKDSLINRGLANLNLNNFDAAIDDATDAIYIDEFDKGYFIRGLANYRKGELNKAILDFSKAINLSSIYFDRCLFFRAVANSRKNNYEKALDDFKKFFDSFKLGNCQWFKAKEGILKDFLDDIPGDMISLVRLHIGNYF